MHPLDNLQHRDGRREGEREGEIQCKVNRLLGATENQVPSGFLKIISVYCYQKLFDNMTLRNIKQSKWIKFGSSSYRKRSIERKMMK